MKQPAQRFFTQEKAVIEIYGHGGSYAADMVNISQTGASFVLSNQSFAPNKGDLINIKVHLQELHRTRFVDAEVVWTNGTELGVAFVPKDQIVEKMLQRAPSLVRN